MTYLFDTDSDQNRSGTQASRNKKDRYFHVMNLGWFVYTREADQTESSGGLETRDGIVGPFSHRQEAINYIQDNVLQYKNDKDSESWRYE